MNITGTPEHTEVEPVLILTPGAVVVFTVMVTVLDVAVDGETQAALEVSTQVTWSLLARAEEE